MPPDVMEQARKLAKGSYGYPSKVITEVLWIGLVYSRHVLLRVGAIDADQCEALRKIADG